MRERVRRTCAESWRTHLADACLLLEWNVMDSRKGPWHIVWKEVSVKINTFLKWKQRLIWFVQCPERCLPTVDTSQIFAEIWRKAGRKGGLRWGRAFSVEGTRCMKAWRHERGCIAERRVWVLRTSEYWGQQGALRYYAKGGTALKGWGYQVGHWKPEGFLERWCLLENGPKG